MVVLLFLPLGLSSADERASEAIIEGYVRAAIEREFELEDFDVTVKGRDVIVWLDAPSRDLAARVQ